MNHLSPEAFKATFSDKAERLDRTEPPPCDIWDYFERIPEEHFGDVDCSEGQVDYVYRMREKGMQHVLVNSTEKNVFMVIVLNEEKKMVEGHRLLNLNEEYGVESGATAQRR